MKLLGECDFRIGGYPGDVKLIFRIAEVGEGVVPLHVYMCPKCGRLELFADEKARKVLLISKKPKGFVKECIKCGEKIPISSDKCPFCKSKQW